ncbi:hypothetical protein GWI33_013282, partial [Rhynchophorus ferrugineus]
NDDLRLSRMAELEPEREGGIGPKRADWTIGGQRLEVVSKPET